MDEKPTDSVDTAMEKLSQLGINTQSRYKLKDVIECCAVETRGHYHSGRAIEIGRGWQYIRHQVCMGLILATFDFEQALDRMSRGIFVPVTDKIRYGLQCSYCGEYLAWECNGKVLRPIENCRRPNGLSYDWDMNFPSGKIVVADDLRRYKFRLPAEQEDAFDIGTAHGCMETTLAMARIGCANGFLGNTCPGIFKRWFQNKYWIGRFGYPDRTKWERFYQPWRERFHLRFRREMASICTDLWWFSIVDLAEFERRNGPIERVEGFTHAFDVMPLRPGVYRFSYLYHKDPPSSDYTRDRVYATFEWLREPDPVRDYDLDAKLREEIAAVHRTLEAYS